MGAGVGVLVGSGVGVAVGVKEGVAVGSKVKVGLGSAVSVGRLVVVGAGVGEAQALKTRARQRTMTNLKSSDMVISRYRVGW